MTVFYTELAWTRSSPDFDYKTYNRNHTIYYANGAVDIEASAAPEYQGDASLPNPEELFISLSNEKGWLIYWCKINCVVILEKIIYHSCNISLHIKHFLWRG